MFKVCLGMKLAKPGGAYRCFTYYIRQSAAWLLVGRALSRGLGFNSALHPCFSYSY